MSGPDVLTRDDDIDVVGIFTALKRKWWLILLVTLLAGIALLITLSIISPRYESTARIFIRDGESTFTRATRDTGNSELRPRFGEEAIRSQVEVIQSDSLILKVFDYYESTDGLQPLTELDEFGGDDEYINIRNRVLEATGQEDRKEPTRKTTKEQEELNRALRMFKEKLSVYAVEKSQIIAIEFWSHNPELAQGIVAKLSELYISKTLNAEILDRNTATGWLDPRVKELTARVKKAEEAVAKERADSDLLRTDNNGLLATQQLSQVSSELSRLKTERSSAQAKAASIRNALKNGSSLDVIPEVIESPLIQRLREREVELRARISDLSTTLLPNHPRMKALNSQLGDFNSQIRAAVSNIAKSLENNVSLTAQAETNLESEISKLKSEAREVERKLVKLRSLERTAEAEAALLSEYKSRALEAQSRSGLTRADAEIISPASLADEAFFPKIIPFTIAGMVAAALLTTLAIIAFSLLSAVSASRTPANAQSSTVRNRDAEPDLGSIDGNGENDPEEDVLVSKPRNHFRELEAVLLRGKRRKERERQAAANEDAETIEGATDNQGEHNGKPIAVRHAVTVLNELEGAHLAVVSPGGNLGSSTSWLLARKLSAEGRQVVLIDLAGAAVCTLKMLGSDNLPGIFNLMTGSVGVDAILYKDRESDVNVVPAGSLFPGNGSLDPELLSEMIRAIAGSFEFCIVDCGDAEIDEALMVANDDTIMVVSCIKVDFAHVELIEEDLRERGLEDVIKLAPDRVDIGKTTETTAA